MVDRLSQDRRSWNMSRIRGKDTAPEITVRSLMHGMGYRYRLHRRDLPGTPDIVLPARRKALLVHGCFWHRHPGCRYAYAPKSRVDYWSDKFEKTVARDKAAQCELEKAGWEVMVIWECELKDTLRVKARLAKFLGSPSRSDAVSAQKPT
jgi:DNA mismatch endonuclease (patch repair protein)